MRAPAFWQDDSSLGAYLSPFAALYDRIATRRFHKMPPHKAPCPVVCIGNFTAGGAGKTPAVMALGKALAERGEKPFVVTKGYGGKGRGPVLVDPASHGAIEVGDEPLLIARHLPTVMCKDRARGAAFAATRGASVILLDDGFQSPDIFKDVSVILVDGARGLGNGRVIPAGPLRLNLPAQLQKADHVVIVGPASHPSIAANRISGWHAGVRLDGAALDRNRGWFAFAGIAHPEKFFASARAAGFELVETRGFPDHHIYIERDAIMLEEAFDSGLGLLTTAKDFVKFRGEEALEALAPKLSVLEMQLDLPEELVDAVLAQCRAASMAFRDAAASI